ncbi:hypothetical protein [Rhodopseudomonas palustris]|uniref:hypothetical protein n=1 Tax=Rhodopseudomonas palustris TaxID=1076 RepID=UPI0003103A5E
MTDAPDLPKTDRNIARQSRLRDALRENLKRRKAQLRGRAEAIAPQTDDISAATSTPSDAGEDRNA